MRVHPDPRKRSHGRSLSSSSQQKKLRRLPHIFSKVLELPLGADADVSVHEDTEGFRFSAAVAEGVGIGIRAHTIEICPGVTKVVIRDADGDEIDELELSRWRFRLPPSTRPALATAGYVDGELVVTVPKGPDSDEDGGDLGGDGVGRIIIAVQ